MAKPFAGSFQVVTDIKSVFGERMAKSELETSRTRSIPLSPLPSTAAASAAKVVVCFVFVKLCILWRLYCCKKYCEKKKKKEQIKLLKYPEWFSSHSMVV